MAVDVNEATGPVWDDRPWAPLPALRGRVDAEVCVVGLGGSGLSAVAELLDRGVDVVGLDAGPVGAAAAGRNGGFFLAGAADFFHRAAAALGTERAAALYRLTFAELDRMLVETPQALRRTGSVRLAIGQDEVDDCRAQLAAMRAAGLPASVYAGPEGYGLLFPRDAAGQPLLRCRVLAGRCRMRRARLFERSPATTVAGTRVTTPAGEVHCQRVVVAVDGRLERVLPELAGRVRTVRAQMLATAPAPEVDIPRPVYARFGYDYWQQLPDRRVVLGGLRDRFPATEGSDRAVPTAALQRQLEVLLRDGLGVRAAVTHRWAGVIGFTEDRLPVLGEVRPGVWATGAYSGTGNVMGSLCGRAAAQLAVGAPSLLADLLAAPATATTTA